MAQESNSGFGSLLMKGITAILSIAVTATVSTIVQRYITPSAAEPGAIAPTISAPLQPVTQPAATQAVTVAPTLVPDTVLVAPVPQTPAPEGQAIDPPAQTTLQPELPVDPQPELQTNAPADPNAPATLQVEPQADPPANSPANPQTNAPADSLRDQLNRSIQDKWNRN
jgi:hypothetical protein